MPRQDVSVGADGKLELTWPGARRGGPVDSPTTAESTTPKQPDAVTVRQELIEQQVQQEAEQSVIAEATEKATSAEPVEPGALTIDRPPAE